MNNQDAQKLSVCMAIFNGEKFLDYQLRSIINNLTGNISIEIIIVDDKSSDRSLKICEDFKSKYINENEKNYFLENFDTIKFYTGNINEIAIIKKK